MRRYPAPKPVQGNSGWSGRDRAAQRTFRRMLIERDGLRCKDCGATSMPLQAHHQTAVDGRLLCDVCHMSADAQARRSR